MFKTRHIIVGSAIALAAMLSSYVAASSVMSDKAEAQAAARWQDKAVAYQNVTSVNRITDKAQVSVTAALTVDDFLSISNVSTPIRDYVQTQSLTPVTFAHHKAAQFIKSEQICLAQAVYYEARSERRSGQIAVAEVVQNRVKSKHYPNSICGVVYQGSGRKSGCQFSFTCDGSMDNMPKGKHWDNALKVAAFMQTHDFVPLTKGATHYHTTAIKPAWSTDLRFDRQIGTHKFYRFRFTERPVVTAPSLAIAPPI